MPSLGVVVIARGLLHGAMLRLLHRFGQGNAAPCRFSQESGAQAVGAELLWIEPALEDAPFQDEIDGLWRKSPSFKVTPTVDATENGPFGDPCARQPVVQGRDGPVY